MGSPWIFEGTDLVRLGDETDKVRIGAGAAPTRTLEVNGSVLGALQDTGGNVFDVKAYGAKGDGVTPDLAAINAAVAAMLNAGGGTLYFPPGQYLVSDEIVIDGYTSTPSPKARPFLVRGAGPGATTILSTNAAANTIKTTFGGAVALGNRDIFMEVRDIMFGATVTKTGGDAIRQECAPEFQNTFLVRNCWFRDVYNAVHLTAIGSAIVEGCVVVNPKNAAIFLEQLFGASTDVGTISITNNYIFSKVGGTGAYGVLATTGASGIRCLNNYFIRFDHPFLMDTVAQGLHTQILIAGNAFDGLSSFPKVQIKGLGTIRRFAISDNRFTGSAPAGVQIDVESAGPNNGLVERGSITDNLFELGGGTDKGIVFNSAIPDGLHEVLVSGNSFSSVSTGIRIESSNVRRLFLGENAFETLTVGTPLVNNGDELRGAFFPDRLGVGSINDITSGVGGASIVKEIYASSDHAVRPRVYLQGLAGTSSPGVEFAFDNANTRRAAIVGIATGSSGAQLEFYSKPDSGPVQRRTILSPQGDLMPGTDNAYNLGQAFPTLLRWKDIFAHSKTSVLNTSFGSGVTMVPVLEGPEYMLYDSGSLTLDDTGEAWVDLDPRFVEIVNTDVPYRVIATGVKLKEKERTRFRVAGDPGDMVDWMVLAVRAGFEKVRFRDAEDAEPVGLADPEHAVERKSPDNNKG